MASDVRAGRAFVELLTKDVSFSKGLDAAAKRLRAFGREMAAAGAATTSLGVGVITPLLAAAKAYSDAGGSLDDAAKQLGTTAADVSTLGYAAEQSGSSLDAVSKAIVKLNRTVGEAVGGSKSARDAFADLGLEWESLAAMDPAERFRVIADALSKIENPARRTAIGAALLGKGFAELLPLISEGRSGIARLEEEARKLGIAFSNEDAEAAEAFGDALDRLWKSARGVWRTIGGALVPVLLPLADTLSAVAASVNRLIAENQTFFQVTLFAAIGVVALGVALTALGGVAVGVSAVLATIKFGLALLASPVTAVVAALAVGGAAWGKYTQSGAAAVAWLSDQLGAFGSFVSTTMGAIGQALAAGDLALAAEVGWSALQVVWTEGVAALMATWQGFTTTATLAANDFATNVAKGITLGMGVAGIAWAETVRGMQDLWSAFWLFAVEVVDTTVTQIAKVISFFWDMTAGFFENSGKTTFERFEATQVKAREYDKELRQRSDQRRADVAAAVVGREEEARKGNAERLDRLKSELDAADSQREETRQQATTPDASPAVSAARAAADEARKAWEAATAEAATKAPILSPGREPPEMPTQDDFESAAEKIGVTGTFSGAVAGMLGAGGDAQERTAKATEETAKLNRTIAKDIRDLNRKADDGGAIQFA